MLMHVSQTAWSAQEALTCPIALSSQAIQITAPSSEWIAFVGHPLNLMGAGLMQGEPVTQAHLKPSRITSNKETEIVIWTFEGDYKEGKWLSCSYGDGGITLSKRIADSYSECTVTYKKIPRGRSVEGVTCR